MTGAAVFEARSTDERHYRFAVKCDRAFNFRLEAAAKRAGVSVTTFVQNHFERILDKPALTVVPKAVEAAAFAREHGVSRHAARLFEIMRARADRNGELRISIHDLEVAARMNAKDVCAAQCELRETGIAVQKVKGGSHGSLWQLRTDL